MPRLDWTWPMGQWPKTGLGRWNCVANNNGNYAQSTWFFGWFRKFWGFWRRMWRGLGRNWQGRKFGTPQWRGRRWFARNR